MPPEYSPFVFGEVVQGQHFLDRKSVLRRLATKVHQGGSALVTGEPRMGKTSVLLHLQRHADELLGREEAERRVFHYLDGQTMGGWDAQRFWREALRPLVERWPEYREVYAAGRFEIPAWEPVFEHMEREGRGLVLLLDEIDALQTEPGLHNRLVYSTLRSLASRYPSLSLVMASRQSITDLNDAARPFAAGSPYFNFAQEIPLGPLPEKYVGELLARGRSRFTPADRRFLRRIAGRHPFFLQVAADALWHGYEDEPNDPCRRYRQASDALLTTVQAVLDDIWASWTPYMQMALTLVALDTLPPGKHPFDLRESRMPANIERALDTLPLEKRLFDLTRSRRSLPDLSQEWAKLARRGFLRPAQDTTFGYTLEAAVVGWYIADKLRALARGETSLGDWLQEQQWGTWLQRQERRAWQKVLAAAGPLLQEGATAFIRALAEAAARAVIS